mgnify:CR=1 FL=1
MTSLRQYYKLNFLQASSLVWRTKGLDYTKSVRGDSWGFFLCTVWVKAALDACNKDVCDKYKHSMLWGWIFHAIAVEIGTCNVSFIFRQLFPEELALFILVTIIFLLLWFCNDIYDPWSYQQRRPKEPLYNCYHACILNHFKSKCMT